jgi:hypothetical protein
MRCLLSWTCYGVGHCVSLLLDATNGWVYPLYNKLMLTSIKIQGDGEGPWVKQGEDGW